MYFIMHAVLFNILVIRQIRSPTKNKLSSSRYHVTMVHEISPGLNAKKICLIMDDKMMGALGKRNRGKMDQICKCSACYLRFLPMWDKFDINDRDRFDLHLYINDV